MCGALTACRLDAKAGLQTEPTFLLASKCECASSSWANSGHCAMHMVGTHTPWVREVVGAVAGSRVGPWSRASVHRWCAGHGEGVLQKAKG